MLLHASNGLHISLIFNISHVFLNQCFLEESRQLMRLPPRQTAEADLMVPFQLVSCKAY